MTELSRQDLGVLRLALETHERVMTERSRPAAATAAHLLRARLADVEPDDWFDRCPATDAGERCGFPSLDSPAWHMHPDYHESLNRWWGGSDVAVRKDERRAEVDRG